MVNVGIPRDKEKIPIFFDTPGFFTRDKKSANTDRLKILITINPIISII
jgi:hypothetical protein